MATMTVGLGAWLAAMAGALSGVLELRLRPEPRQGSALLGAVAGAIIGVLAYGAFLAAGLVMGLLTWSTTPEPWPALLGVIVGCAALLGMRALHSALVPRFGMPERRPSEPRSFSELIEAQPRGGAPTMWLGGVGLALLPLLYGIGCVVTQRGELGTTIWRSDVEGGAAIALGVGWIGVGLYLHFHFFFGLHQGLTRYSRRGKSLGLVLACAGLAVAGAWSVIGRVL